MTRCQRGDVRRKRAMKRKGPCARTTRTARTCSAARAPRTYARTRMRSCTHALVRIHAHTHTHTHTRSHVSRCSTPAISSYSFPSAPPRAISPR
eukprot:6208361-Pleurochrysis_carterae.AAC.5